MSSRFLIMLATVLMVSGCSQQDYPALSSLPHNLVPKPDSVQEIKNVQITYILPHGVENRAGTLNGLSFEQYSSGTDTNRKILQVDFTAKGLLVERRDDNGSAGSGVICAVDVNTISKPDSVAITLSPKTQKTYQQGLILPFPIPHFDIESYLETAKIDYKFELDSGYPPSSVEANFKRLLSASSYGGNIYRLNNETEDFEIEVKIYPYKKDGSKITIHATLHNKKSQGGVVDVAKKIDGLKRKIREVVNA